MTDDLAELQNLLSINEEDIGLEWHKQPKLYTQISRYAARCHAKLSEAELNLKILEAHLDETIRTTHNDPNKRLTERALELAVHRRAEWQAARTACIERTEQSEIADALQKAAEMRERSLIRLSQRHLGGNLEDDERLMAIVKRIVREQSQLLIRGIRHGQTRTVSASNE